MTCSSHGLKYLFASQNTTTAASACSAKALALAPKIGSRLSFIARDPA